MKVWITKYALTAGIVEVVDAEIDGDGNAMAQVGPRGIKDRTYRQFIRAIDVHQPQELAARRARQMKELKIMSLRRQIRKLEDKTFL